MAPEGKNSSVLSTPNMARGTSGSSTRTIIRNIMPLKAMEVTDDEQQQLQIGDGMEDGAQTGHQRADDSERNAGQHGLDGAGNVQAHHQFELGDGSDQVALVHAAGLVVDVEHAAADHHRDVHGERDRSRRAETSCTRCRDKARRSRARSCFTISGLNDGRLSASTSDCISASRLRSS